MTISKSIHSQSKSCWEIANSEDFTVARIREISQRSWLARHIKHVEIYVGDSLCAGSVAAYCELLGEMADGQIPIRISFTGSLNNWYPITCTLLWDFLLKPSPNCLHRTFGRYDYQILAASVPCYALEAWPRMWLCNSKLASILCQCSLYLP